MGFLSMLSDLPDTLRLNQGRLRCLVPLVVPQLWDSPLTCVRDFPWSLGALNFVIARATREQNSSWPPRDREFLYLTPQGLPEYFYFTIPTHLGLCLPLAVQTGQGTYLKQ